MLTEGKPFSAKNNDNNNTQQKFIKNLSHHISIPEDNFNLHFTHSFLHSLLQGFGLPISAKPTHTSSFVPSLDHPGSYLVPPSEGLSHPLNTSSVPNMGSFSSRRHERLVAQVTLLSTCGVCPGDEPDTSKCMLPCYGDFSHQNVPPTWVFLPRPARVNLIYLFLLLPHTFGAVS